MSGPDIWGPHGWKFIHYVTLGYPQKPSSETKKQYTNFFLSLRDVIPCSICGNNFRIHMKQYPLTDEILSDKQLFVEWGITMHNLVNLSNNKKIYDNEEGLEEIIKTNTGDCPGYTNFSINKDNDNTSTIENKNKDKNVNKHKLYNKILVVIILLLLLFLIYKHINK